MPIPTDKREGKHAELPSLLANAYLKTEAYQPNRFYELTVQWPHNRVTYVASKEDSYGHLRSVAAKAEELKADACLRIHSSESVGDGMDPDVADAILWREGKVRVRALELFRKHAHKSVQHHADVLCNQNRIKEAAELVKPYSVYCVQAYDNDESMKTLSVDFDGTITNTEYAEFDAPLGEPIPGAIEALIKLISEGWHIAVMSSRARTIEGEEEIMQWLERYGVPQVVVTSTKVPADIYVDDRAIHFEDWDSALAAIENMPKQSSLCGQDNSVLEWNAKEKGWACPACNKKFAFLDRVAAMVYTLIPGDKVNVRSVEGSTLGDAYLLYKADAHEERALKSANLWLTYFPGGQYLPVAEELVTKIGHDDNIRRDAMKIMNGSTIQITAREDIPLRYDIDNIIEATLTEANSSKIPLDSVLVAMAAKHQLTPEDLDVVTEACLSLVEPVKADLSPTDARLVNATRDALEESDAFFADAEQVPDEDDEVQMVLGYLADEFNWSDELNDDEIVSTTKEVISNLREEKVEKHASSDGALSVTILRPPRWVKRANMKTWENACDEFGDKGYCATISAFRFAYQKEKHSTAEETDRIDSETQDYTPTNLPSLTSVPESEYDVVRQQTEAEGKEKEEGIRRYGPGKFSTILDSLISALSSDGWVAEECGEVQYTGWYGTMSMPSVEDLNAEAKEQGVEPLTQEEIEYVNENKGGVIIFENNSGFVDIAAYPSEEERKKEWDRISTEVNKEMDDAENSEASMENEPYRGTDIDNVQAAEENKCPKCGSELRVTDYKGKTFSSCPKCFDSWKEDKQAANEEHPGYDSDDRWTKMVYECPSCETTFTEAKKPHSSCPICRAPADKLKSITADREPGSCPRCGTGIPGKEFCDTCKKQLKEIQDEWDRKKAILDKSIANLKLTEPQLKIVAGIRETIDSYTDSFLSTVGQFFTYDWDPGASWEVKEVKGKKMIVRKDPPKKAAKATRHAYQEGQVLKMFDGVIPVDVKVVALLGEDRYKIQSSINKQELECDELDLFTIDTDPQLFN